jgi:energy-converting hydrogenase Eha subunit C
MAIAVNGNIPLNNLIKAGQLSDGTTWETIRAQWLNFMRIRGVFTSIGMIILLMGLVLKVKE